MPNSIKPSPAAGLSSLSGSPFKELKDQPDASPKALEDFVGEPLRKLDGTAADYFIRDDASPRVGTDHYVAPGDEIIAEALNQLASNPAQSRMEPQAKPGEKTLELAHLSHLIHLPLSRVSSSTGSVLLQMGQGDERERLALYAKYAAELALGDKKKRKKRGVLQKIRDFFRSVFA